MLSVSMPGGVGIVLGRGRTECKWASHQPPIGLPSTSHQPPISLPSASHQASHQASPPSGLPPSSSASHQPHISLPSVQASPPYQPPLQIRWPPISLPSAIPAPPKKTSDAEGITLCSCVRARVVLPHSLPPLSPPTSLGPRVQHRHRSLDDCPPFSLEIWGCLKEAFFYRFRVHLASSGPSEKGSQIILRRWSRTCEQSL
jgi:hypothetical protein